MYESNNFAHSIGWLQGVALGLLIRFVFSKVGILTIIGALVWHGAQPKNLAPPKTPGVDLEPGYEHVELPRPFPFNLFPRG